MYPRDIKEMYGLVQLGTPVNIIHQPVKVGWKQNVLYAEVHALVHKKNPGEIKDKMAYKKSMVPLLLNALTSVLYRESVEIDWNKVFSVAERQSGFPEAIGHRV
jgi:L,D-transpeptidase ErfK/SrfK